LEVSTGNELYSLVGQEHPTTAVIWNPKNAWVATAGKDGLIQIFTTDIDELLGISNNRITRQLTSEEQEKYGLLD